MQLTWHPVNAAMAPSGRGFCVREGDPLPVAGPMEWCLGFGRRGWMSVAPIYVLSCKQATCKLRVLIGPVRATNSKHCSFVSGLVQLLCCGVSAAMQ